MHPVVVATAESHVREQIRGVLARHGHGGDVKNCSSGTEAFELATSQPVGGVIAQAELPDMSGVQLFRLLDQDSSLADVPLVLVTAAGDARMRLFSNATCPRCHVIESPEGELPALLDRFGGGPSLDTRAGRAMVERELLRRLSSALDDAMFEAVVAAEVRALAACEGYEQFFDGLETLLRRLLRPSWVALLVDGAPPALFLAAPHGRRAESDAAARAALGVGHEIKTLGFRATPVESWTPSDACVAVEVPVFSGNNQCGQLALGLPRRGHTHTARRTVDLVAAELGGPWRIVSLLEEARRNAATDMLTGLMNRRALLEQVARESRRAQRYGHALSVLLVDIDHFKQINDVHGHFAGDKVIQTVAATSQRALRQSDLIARWGGEEFLVALPCTDVVGGLATAERLRRAVEEARTPVAHGTVLAVTVSIGAAHASAPWSFDELARAADVALYDAKTKGRNRVYGGREPVSSTRLSERPAPSERPSRIKP